MSGQAKPARCAHAPADVKRGIKLLRELAYARTSNPALSDAALADLESAENWLDEGVFGKKQAW